MPLLIRRATVVTPVPSPSSGTPTAPRAGAALREIEIRPETDVLCDGDRIVEIGRNLAGPTGVRIIESGGRLLTPGLVDCHTHACWGGDRIGEWERKLAGATYLEIMASGGGIMSTVRSTRAAGRQALADATLGRLNRMLASGTTTAEVKSGYGLLRDDELTMLHAISDASRRWPGHVVATALLGHAVDPDTPDFFASTVEATLPRVTRAFPGVAIDAFCEKGAWTAEWCVRLFEAARAAGHPVRMHIDQFTPMGMIAEAIRLGARTVDHLEASTPEDLAELAASTVIGVGLPVCGYHVDGRYANLRRLTDLGGTVAIATNLNPGSAPCASMPMAMGLAVRHCGLTAAEAFIAGTVNGAAALGLTDRGVLAPGLRADLVLWDATDYRELSYWVGGPAVRAVVVGGTTLDQTR